VVDAELFRLDSVIRWLDAADARFRRADTPETLAAESSTPEPIPTQQAKVSR
jgi:hypothetical protein